MPDQCNIIADYAGGPSVVMMNSLSNFTGIETVIRGTDGIIIFGGIDNPKTFAPKGIRIVPAAKGPGNPDCLEGGRRYQPAVEYFFDRIKTRQRPYSPIDIAVRVQAPLNMGILSYPRGQGLPVGTRRKKIVMS